MWGVVATATANGELGIAAKVATTDAGEEGEGKARLVCVYTGDFGDGGDVRRVVGRLVGLGVVGAGGGGGGGGERGIYYKSGEWMDGVGVEGRGVLMGNGRCVYAFGDCGGE